MNEYSTAELAEIIHIQTAKLINAKTELIFEQLKEKPAPVNIIEIESDIKRYELFLTVLRRSYKRIKKLEEEKLHK